MTLVDAPAEHCADPQTRGKLTAYSFNDLDDERRLAVALHLVECDLCWQEVQRLEACVDALRHSPNLKAIPPSPEVFSVLCLSGRLDQPFGGHLRHVVVAGSLFALLHAVPVLVEVAYQFDQFGAAAVRLALLAFVWMLSATLYGLWLDVRAVRQGSGGLGPPLVTWGVATVMLCLVLWQFLPASATVDASFGTWPANLGYLKSLFYAWLVGPLFLLWPFHFVVVIQRELTLGHHQMVLSLLTGEKRAVPPRGAMQPKAWALAVFLGGVFVLNYAGVTHLFEALTPGPYAYLFRSLVLVRASAWLLLPAICLWWYMSCVNELKREALLTSRLLAKS